MTIRSPVCGCGPFPSCVNLKARTDSVVIVSPIFGRCCTEVGVSWLAPSVDPRAIAAPAAIATSARCLYAMAWIPPAHSARGSAMRAGHGPVVYLLPPDSCVGAGRKRISRTSPGRTAGDGTLVLETENRQPLHFFSAAIREIWPGRMEATGARRTSSLSSEIHTPRTSRSPHSPDRTSAHTARASQAP